MFLRDSCLISLKCATKLLFLDTFVAEMKAIDSDSLANGDITYSMSDSTLFKVDQSSGVVETFSQLTQASFLCFTSF